MHSFDHDGYTVHHNGDFSGDVTIVIPDSKRDRFGEDPVKTQDRWEPAGQLKRQVERWFEVTVPFELLEALVAEKVRSDLVGLLEDADPAAVLKAAALLAQVTLG